MEVVKIQYKWINYKHIGEIMSRQHNTSNDDTGSTVQNEIAQMNMWRGQIIKAN